MELTQNVANLKRLIVYRTIDWFEKLLLLHEWVVVSIDYTITLFWMQFKIFRDSLHHRPKIPIHISTKI